MKQNLLLLYSMLLSMLTGYKVHGQVYRLEFTSSSSYSPSILKADTLRYKSHLLLEAALQVQTLQESPQRSYARLQLIPRLFQVSDEGLMEEPDMVVARRLLSLPVYIQQNDSGRVVQVYFDTLVTSTYRQLWNQMIAYMQFIKPGETKPPTASWRVSEEDRVGFFEARYERTGGKEQSSHFRKQGGGYSAFSSQGLIDYAQQLSAEYVLDNEWLSVVALDELLEVKVKGDTRATTSSSFKLHKTGSLIAADSIAGKWRLSDIKPGLAAVTLSNFVTRHEMKTAMYRQLLQQQTLEDVLLGIDTLTLAEARDDKGRINRKVAALVYLYPALLDSFMERIAAAPPSSPAFQVIVKGLAHAGTPAAQEKIGGLLHQHRYNAEAIDFFTNTLLFLEEPGTALIASVQRIAYDRQQFDASIQRALRYLLGSFSHTLKKSNPVLGTTTAMNTLLAIKQDSRKPAKEKVLELLGVAGNAGANATFTMIRDYAGDLDEDIHAQALMALRLIDTTAVDTLLLQQFISDTNVLFQSVILTVFRYRPVTMQVIDAVTDMLAGVQDQSLAISGARLLYENKKAFTAVIPVLQRLAGQTANTALKKEIHALLQSDNSSD